ncbi:MAG: class I SAM-dependent methyltransferase [Gammaproteobacteria bacterium]|nr:class I SAM-dependent methyltransferase [Gammaproteobacteria bacterium]MDH3374390.1 class I SAM-dependent methyltransferase [Gammaproteobacteria bacterium]MDH3409871.1 class I SAM-dependent methyltransferase [Gammaproteobacteria bacterium]MDH3554150.1 class I SAM-dependent methyltransferase [Gammaproteobacteria bacterium]
MSDKPYAPATERNKHAILGVIREEFRDCTSILEIGSGTGQHAVHFAAELGHLTWQTSDVQENHPGILAWLRDAALTNTYDPLVLDVLTARIPDEKYDGVFAANTAHIMPFEAVERMFSLTAAVLNNSGVFILYGPFRMGGQFNTPSNAAFHDSLRQQNPEMGIRHLEDLDRLAAAVGMRRVRLYAMPANNHIAVWIKQRPGANHDNA